MSPTETKRFDYSVCHALRRFLWVAGHRHLCPLEARHSRRCVLLDNCCAQGAARVLDQRALSNARIPGRLLAAGDRCGAGATRSRTPLVRRGGRAGSVACAACGVGDWRGGGGTLLSPLLYSADSAAGLACRAILRATFIAEHATESLVHAAWGNVQLARANCGRVLNLTLARPCLATRPVRSRTISIKAFRARGQDFRLGSCTEHLSRFPTTAGLPLHSHFSAYRLYFWRTGAGHRQSQAHHTGSLGHPRTRFSQASAELHRRCEVRPQRGLSGAELSGSGQITGRTLSADSANERRHDLSTGGFFPLTSDAAAGQRRTVELLDCADVNPRKNLFHRFRRSHDRGWHHRLRESGEFAVDNCWFEYRSFIAHCRVALARASRRGTRDRVRHFTSPRRAVRSQIYPNGQSNARGHDVDLECHRPHHCADRLDEKVIAWQEFVCGRGDRLWCFCWSRYLSRLFIAGSHSSGFSVSLRQR